jgi:hypothetical protein
MRVLGAALLLIICFSPFPAARKWLGNLNLVNLSGNSQSHVAR